MERIEVIVRGKVQMVMYRDFTQRMARARRLVGFVQNLSDGTVRVIAEGERDALSSFVIKLRSGPTLARVSGVDIVTVPATGEFSSFELLRNTA